MSAAGLNPIQEYKLLLEQTIEPDFEQKLQQLEKTLVEQNAYRELYDNLGMIKVQPGFSSLLGIRDSYFAKVSSAQRETLSKSIEQVGPGERHCFCVCGAAARPVCSVNN